MYDPMDLMIVPVECERVVISSICQGRTDVTCPFGLAVSAILNNAFGSISKSVSANRGLTAGYFDSCRMAVLFAFT